MKKSKTPTFIVERRCYTNIDDEFILNKIFDCANKIYNVGVKHYREVIENLYKDSEFLETLESFYTACKKKDEDLIEKYSQLIFAIMKKYKLTEYDIHSYLGYEKVNAFEGAIGINIVQKLGSELYESIKKAVFRKTKIHYRKKGQTDCLSEKKANSGIIYKENKGVVYFKGRNIKLKPIRKTDTYMMEALSHKVKYCKFVRKPFKNGYKYFLQIVLEGKPPKKLTKGKNTCGIDQGTSTLAEYNGKSAKFTVLADGVEKYNKEIQKLNDKYFRRLRLNNPNCFNEDGTIKKGIKFKNRTKGSNKALFELKNAYRKQTVYKKQELNKLVNRLISENSMFIKEEMNFKALQKRSKKTEKQETKSTITKKDGSEIEVYKNKKKKRFGKSIGNRCPGYLDKQLKKRCAQYECIVIEVDTKEYKASKMNHITETAENIKLSDRSKIIGKVRVQRDLYSSFLLFHSKNEKEIDYKACKKDFKNFIKRQAEVVEEIKNKGDKTKNFGIKAFI